VCRQRRVGGLGSRRAQNNHSDAGFVGRKHLLMVTCLTLRSTLFCNSFFHVISSPRACKNDFIGTVFTVYELHSGEDHQDSGFITSYIHIYMYTY
jgi:hypothetical protein